MVRFFCQLSSRVAGGLLLACAFAAAGASAASRLTVEESAAVAAPPAVVWQLVGDYQGIAGWHPAVAAADITRGRNNVHGAVRTITTKEGARIVEELISRDKTRRTLRYRIVESPLPVKNYVATMSVQPEGFGSRIAWKSHFERGNDVDDAGAREIIAGIYRTGFDGLRARFGEPAPTKD